MEAVRRADIWMAKLPYNTGDLLRGEHPVLILSNHRSNKSSNLVTIIPLTSTIGSSTSNVIIGTEFGLKNKSCLLTNQTQTISKGLLLFKVCFITTPKMDEVMQVLATHLGIKNMGALEMFKMYEQKRMEIKVAKCQNDFVKMEQLAQEYMKNLYKIGCVMQGEDIYSELEWVNFYLALAKKKHGELIEAYTIAKKALGYSTSKNSDYYYSCWLIGSINILMGDEFKVEGCRMFDECIEFYKSIGEKKYEILSIFNKNLINHNILEMQKCIETYRNSKFIPMLYTIRDMGKDDVLEEMEMELANIL